MVLREATVRALADLLDEACDAIPHYIDGTNDQVMDALAAVAYALRNPK